MVTESRPYSSMTPSAVSRGSVARHRVAHAVDHREGAGGLVGVAEVAERHPALLGEPADLVVAGLERGRRGRR